MLVGETPHLRCRIYTHRSKVCMQFPISEEDLGDVNYQCGYSFRTADNVSGDVDQASKEIRRMPDISGDS
jgi:Fe-S-cluster containining protein